MLRILCPYCGGRCETFGGPDGNPFNKDLNEITACTVCGRTVSNSEPFSISEEDLKELMTDADILDKVEDPMIKISARADAAGIVRETEATVPFKDGTYPLVGGYPFGRSDIDQNPPFSLNGIRLNGDEITIAGETFTLEELPKIITKKLTAYGYGYVPWEETINITVSME